MAFHLCEFGCGESVEIDVEVRLVHVLISKQYDNAPDVLTD